MAPQLTDHANRRIPKYGLAPRLNLHLDAITPAADALKAVSIFSISSWV